MAHRSAIRKRCRPLAKNWRRPATSLGLGHAMPRAEPWWELGLVGICRALAVAATVLCLW
eukprot:scaffold40574_cov27-Tisochrysis_lutea.AAC.3